MKLVLSLAIGSLAVLAACNGNATDQIENSIRENLAQRGNVVEVEMNQGADGNLSGHAVVRDAQGVSSRLNCTASRGSGTNYNWQCLPVIDDQVVEAMEHSIRQTLSRQGEVSQVDMTRQDDNRMTGFAVVRPPNGIETRMSCSASRVPPGIGGTLNWECRPGGDNVPGQAEAGDAGSGEGEGGK